MSEQSPHSDFTPEQEDLFHTHILLDTDRLHALDQLGTAVDTRYQLRWICNHCRDFHKITGTMDQVQNTATAMMLLGYPAVLIHDLAFLEFIHSHGDVEDMAERIQYAAEDFHQFCAHTRG